MACMCHTMYNSSCSHHITSGASGISSSSLSVHAEGTHCMTVMTRFCLPPSAAGINPAVCCVPWINTTCSTCTQLVVCTQDIPLRQGKVRQTEFSSSQHASPLRELTCHMGSHSVTWQRWHSRPYSSRSWYSIKRPQRNARLSWPSWLVTHLFNGPLSRTTQVSRYQKVKPIWILLKQETVSGISWAICKSAPRSRQITTPAPHHSVFLQAGCPSCRPTNSVKALKAGYIPRWYTRAWSPIHPMWVNFVHARNVANHYTTPPASLR